MRSLKTSTVSPGTIPMLTSKSDLKAVSRVLISDSPIVVNGCDGECISQNEISSKTCRLRYDFSLDFWGVIMLIMHTVYNFPLSFSIIIASTYPGCSQGFGFWRFVWHR